MNSSQDGPSKRRTPGPRFAGETRVKLFGVPLDFTTRDLWEIFRGEGDIVHIDLFVRNDGLRIDQGSVTFCTQLRPAFLHKRRYQGSLARSPNRQIEIRLQFDSVVSNGAGLLPRKLLVTADSLAFGSRCAPLRAMTMKTLQGMHGIPIVLGQDSKHREIQITFPLASGEACVNHFKIVISHTCPLSIWEVATTTNPDQRVLVIAVENVPEFFVKHDDSKSHNTISLSWSDQRAWHRKTDIPKNASSNQGVPISLQMPGSRIDLGRWRVYRLSFTLSSPEGTSNYARFCQMLEDFNITIQRQQEFQFDVSDAVPVWAFIDEDPSAENAKPSSSLADLQDSSMVHLPFPVRYQLEVCISEDLLLEYNVSLQFLQALQDLGATRAVSLLEAIATDGKRIHDPMSLIRNGGSHTSSRGRKIPPDFTFIYSAVVTPTTIYYSTPSIEISNRVIRQFSQYHDRFLRVRFTEERPRGRLFPRPADANGRTPMDEVYNRVGNTLRNGIVIGDRHYEFLGFGNSQFREHGAYFFAAVEHLSAANIRAWMGDFRHIKSVSKHAARIGQCFSTTRPVRGATALVSELPDIKTADGKYTFTDGVGRISKPMAQLAAMEMGIATLRGESPSVIQFRSGGAKGVLAVHEAPSNSEDNKKLSIWIRPSQYKFHAKYERLEVVRWSQYSAAHLNRQLIIVLSALGVPDGVFNTMMRGQLKKLDSAMTDEKVALALLQRDVDPNQMTLTVATMVLDGFQRVKEPFLSSVLQLWRAWSIKFLKEKAKIAVKEGAVLLGCIDELGVLNGHFHARQPKISNPSDEEKFNGVPEIFVQLSKGADARPEVITGYMILARNPSLHPGDVRVVRGVDRPGLRHLKDVVVLPQTGDRDLASMCSGGDLDGDDYIVIWDKELLPNDWNCEPMDYTATVELKLERDVTINDIIEFFITYMKNDALGTIANAHLATADKEPAGVRSSKCLRLAELHSEAVDYPKSGKAVQMTSDLRPREMPHFMNPSKTRGTYKSKKVLGQLFDLVERVDFVPRYDAVFDSRVLGKYKVSAETFGAATSIKRKYDAALRRIMKQYAILTEFEVWSTFVMSHVRQGSDFKFHEIIGGLSAALKETYRAECYDAAGGRDDQKIVPFVAAMYEVTWNEVTGFVEAKPGQEGPTDQDEKPLISFPWLFPSILGKIAKTDSTRLMSTISASAAHQVSQPKQSVDGEPREPEDMEEARDPQVVGSGAQQGQKARSSSNVSILDAEPSPLLEAEMLPKSPPVEALPMIGASEMTADLINLEPATEADNGAAMQISTATKTHGMDSLVGLFCDMSCAISEVNGDPYDAEDEEEELDVPIFIPDLKSKSLLQQLADL